jgi:hypothetical protein
MENKLKNKPENIKQILAYYVIMKNRVMFRDFWLPEAWGKYYKTRYYQYPMALNDDIVVLGGRSCGKSVCLESTILQTSLNEPNQESLLSAFRKLHVKDRLEKVIGFFSIVKYFRKFLLGDADRSLKMAVRRSPTYEIKLKNRHVIQGISTGEDPMAIGIQGSHGQYRYLEESQSYSRDAWVKFQSARDPKFVRDRFYGACDGRIDTPYYDCDNKISKFKNKRFHLSRRLEPWFDQETKNNLIETFKGEDSNEFKQQCDGEWGEPVWGVWPEKDIIKCLDKKEDPQHPGIFSNQITTIILTPNDYKNMSPDQVLWNLPKLPENDLEVILGIDGGYSEPTVVLPFFYYKNKWNLQCKILLRDKIIPDDQAELIDYICDFYNAMIIAFDCTSADGRAVAQALANPKRKEYINKKYPERIIHVNFNSTEVIGYTDKDRSFREGDEDKKYKEEEIKERVKNLTTIELYKLFSNHMFHIYYDEDLLGEFNSEVQKKGSSGTYTILTPRDVHIPEAFRCFAFAYWKKYGKTDKPEKQSNNYSFVMPEYGDSGISLFGKGKSKSESTDTKIS